MRTQQLLIENWFIKQLETDKPDIVQLTREATSPNDQWLDARMPAQVHDVLFEHGKITDPHIGKNAADCAWVGEKDWAYACKFAGPESTGGPVFLRFAGLDTLAEVYLNGSHLGSFDNMFREYCVDIAEHLSPPRQNNLLLIIFSSPLRFVGQVEQPPEHVGRISKNNYLRKASNDFGTYLGARPHFVKVGVYRDVILDAPDRAWIEDLCVRTELTPDFARANVRVTTQTAGSTASVEWKLASPSGDEVARGTAHADGSINIELDDPSLWWPWTHGAPDLYRLRVDLVQDGQTLDSRDVTFGIRHIEPVLSDPETGEKRFKFEINGQSIFLKGACWAPAEGMTHCWPHDRAMRLLDIAQHGRMNVVRMWGGGYVPPEEFYAECDRRGILIWQDFMFEAGMHPCGEPAFDDNCRAEVEGVVARLRNHPCILLWSGGNENHMSWDFRFGGEPEVGRELFEGIMPEACARLDPTRMYHPSSPYGGRQPNWPLEGDWHDYSTITFCHEASVPLFISELGRVSAMPLASMKKFLTDDELWPAGYDPAIRTPGQPAWPPMWAYRSVDGSWLKVAALEEFCHPPSAEDLIRVLGTAHGEYLQRRVEKLRRGVPDGSPDGSRRCWGNTIWRLNDAWPILYWSAIDYYLEPKIAFYFLRRAYAPVLVCFEQTPDNIAVWVVNDSPEPVAGTLEVRRMHFDGTVHGELEAPVELRPAQSARCMQTTDLGPISLYHEFLHADFAGVEA
ncbi:MAG: hypothetical protein HQ592_01650, partial [Planctomycetes bacterium]|nr:hypothetical protein [Planctomycetota bacterium]